MSPSCWPKSVPKSVRCLPLAAIVLLSLTSSGSASINRAGALMIPATIAQKYCSGAFRYAARDGNSDIAPLSDAQAFANNRRFARTRYAERAMVGLDGERSRLHALTVMCGGR
jgi:hypothetical protein